MTKASAQAFDFKQAATTYSTFACSQCHLLHVGLGVSRLSR